jgi:hypothetical protein
MAIAFPCLPYVLITKNCLKKKKIFYFYICGVLFASDVAVWNIAIQESSATKPFIN